MRCSKWIGVPCRGLALATIAGVLTKSKTSSAPVDWCKKNLTRGKALRRLSSMDRMTGVYNRGYFDERLSAEMSRARRQSEPLALVMLDVDHFKRFNDNHGHAAGDAGHRATRSGGATSWRATAARSSWWCCP